MELNPMETGLMRIPENGHVKLSCIVPQKVLRFIPLSKYLLEASVSKSIVKGTISLYCKSAGKLGQTGCDITCRTRSF
eukprot:scaffold3670_cov124-Cylindrotheca_fusiformis.AAC.11